MGGVFSLVAVTLIGGASWTLGTVALSRMTWPELRVYERAALRLTAGLGLTAVLIGLLALAGWFSWTTPILGVLSMIGVVLLFQNASRSHETTAPQKTRMPLWVKVTFAAVAIC